MSGTTPSPPLEGSRGICRATIADLFCTALAGAGRARLKVTGKSMAPLLRPGDEVEVVAAEAGALRGGEVVVLLGRDRSGAPAELVIHRYWMTTPDGLLVRGDGAGSADPFWPPEAVRGVVRARHRDGRRTELSREPRGWGARARLRGGRIIRWWTGKPRRPIGPPPAGGSLG